MSHRTAGKTQLLPGPSPVTLTIKIPGTTFPSYQGHLYVKQFSFLNFRRCGPRLEFGRTVNAPPPNLIAGIFYVGKKILSFLIFFWRRCSRILLMKLTEAYCFISEFITGSIEPALPLAVREIVGIGRFQKWDPLWREGLLSILFGRWVRGSAELFRRMFGVRGVSGPRENGENRFSLNHSWPPQTGWEYLARLPADETSQTGP